ncbi:DUF1178 family protein [Pannonibacter indicus]|uniref:Uncharacterized protein n=1 Tax=Pannonibacter indicus TaxID=466044 RepID=A0A0K6IBP0_9HYPH|nr:DUF1178 family protein [Pannonibacter indicus]CUB00737.1 Uncharacterized protein Ga0061067_12113 [Pannonibacter indicus]
MIRYTLRCDNAHEFEGWFRNSGDFERQTAQGLMSCPACGSDDVTKALMAPAVSTSERRESLAPVSGAEAAAPVEAPAAPAGAGATSAMIASDSRHAELLQKLRELRQQIVSNADYVGQSFADEARKMHYGEADHRSIYGETSPDDAQALLEEGISILPLPVLPEDRN